jgi:flagellar basal body-associated protein FliL
MGNIPSDFVLILIGIIVAAAAVTVVIRIYFKSSKRNETTSEQKGNIVGGDIAGRDIIKKG